MKSGFFLSGTAHGLLISFLFVNGIFFMPERQYENLEKLLNKSEAKRKLKGFGPGGITLPLNFQLPDKFGLENLSSK